MATVRKSRTDDLLTTLSKNSLFDEIAAIREGLPYAKFESLRQHLKLSESDIREALDIPQRTLARRKSGKRFSPQESELIIRLAKSFVLAKDVLGTADRASNWLTTENTALGDVTPISLLDTGPGFQEVINVLHRIEYGVYS